MESEEEVEEGERDGGERGRGRQKRELTLNQPARGISYRTPSPSLPLENTRVALQLFWGGGKKVRNAEEKSALESFNGAAA